MEYRNTRKASLLRTAQEILANKAVGIISISSLKAEEMFAIRKKMWDFDGNINIVKNSIANLAIKNLGLSCLEGSITKVTAFAYCNANITAFLRSLLEISKEYTETRFNVLSCKVDQGSLNIDLIKEFASLEDIQHIYLKLVNVLNLLPLSLINNLNSQQTTLVNYLDYYNKGTT